MSNPTIHVSDREETPAELAEGLMQFSRYLDDAEVLFVASAYVASRSGKELDAATFERLKAIDAVCGEGCL